MLRIEIILTIDYAADLSSVPDIGRVFSQADTSNNYLEPEPELTTRLRSQVTACQDLNTKIKSALSNLSHNIEYQVVKICQGSIVLYFNIFVVVKVEKKKFYQSVGQLSDSIDKIEKYSEQHNLENLDDLEIENKKLLEFEHELESIKSLAASLSLHKGNKDFKLYKI